MKYTLTTSNTKYIHSIAKDFIGVDIIDKNGKPINGTKEISDGDIVFKFADGYISEINYAKYSLSDEECTVDDVFDFAGYEKWENGYPVNIITPSCLEEHIYWKEGKLIKIVTENYTFDFMDKENIDYSLSDENYNKKFGWDNTTIRESKKTEFLHTKDYLIAALKCLAELQNR